MRSTWPTSGSTCRRPGPTSSRTSTLSGGCPIAPANTHKWQAAVRVVAGSPGMTGAAHLVSAAAFRAGAGYVTLSSPGIESDPLAPTEVVGRPLPDEGVGRARPRRCRALRRAGRRARAGHGRHGGRRRAGRGRRLARSRRGRRRRPDRPGGRGAGRRRPGHTVLTPHDGEFARLAGGPPAPDRFAAVRELAAATGAVVLLKGSDDRRGRPRRRGAGVHHRGRPLATAGTGDVLSGIIGALLARWRATGPSRGRRGLPPRTGRSRRLRAAAWSPVTCSTGSRSSSTCCRSDSCPATCPPVT